MPGHDHLSQHLLARRSPPPGHAGAVLRCIHQQLIAVQSERDARDSSSSRSVGPADTATPPPLYTPSPCRTGSLEAFLEQNGLDVPELIPFPSTSPAGSSWPGSPPALVPDEPGDEPELAYPYPYPSAAFEAAYLAGVAAGRGASPAGVASLRNTARLLSEEYVLRARLLRSMAMLDPCRGRPGP